MNNNNNSSQGNNAANNVKINKMRGKDFNKLMSESIKDITLKNGKNASKSKYKNEKEYQASFDDIITFSKNYTETSKKQIDAVIYHDENNDGFVSAYIAWLYLVYENKKNVKFFPMKPSHGQNVNKRVSNIENIISGKNVLIVDISYSNATFDFIKSKSKSMIVIDDHFGRTTFQDKNVFVGKDHAAVAYVWKFFYPKKPVPKIMQYVDDSDFKMHLPFIPFSNLFSVSLGFRFVHNKMKQRGQEIATFEELHELFKDDNPNFWIYIGKYFEEVRDNLKNQIAINAQPISFQGYNVGILNFNAPSLSKPVGRQILTNLNKFGKKIDFAVLWGYEYNANPPAYRIQLVDDHVQTTINMGQMAEKLGKLGKHPKGGGGKPHMGNFYWTRDINELFTKKF